MSPSGSLVVFAVSVAAFLYIKLNDRRLTSLPPPAAAVSPHRWTGADIRAEHARTRAQPTDGSAALPPRTGRHYVVVGGAGFLGGWFVVHLLRRGENPACIRVLDVRLPTRSDLTTGPATLVDFRVCDVSDAAAVHAAFAAPWLHTNENGPDASLRDPEITVFHTAANIRFYERAWSLVPLSAAVNVHGMQNVIDAARAVGATVLITTSSGSVCVRRSRFWLWPWESSPPFFVQAIDDADDAPWLPRQHAEFFSNYAYTKSLGEALVRGADGSSSGKDGARTLRTGCLRPGNGIYGPGGDVLCGAALVREHNPSWIASIMQNFVYVENASLAHLCYEQRLLALLDPSTPPSVQPDIGGQAFCIADAGPPPTYGDVYYALSVLSEGRTTFPTLSPTCMLLFAHLLESLHLLRHFLLRLSPPLRSLACLAPQLPGDLLNLQPSLFALVSVHMLFNDARARAPPASGGLGYTPRWTTLQGLCTLVDDFEQSGRVEEARQRSGGGISFGLEKLNGLCRIWHSKHAVMPTPAPIVQAQAWSLDVDVHMANGNLGKTQ